MASRSYGRSMRPEGVSPLDAVEAAFGLLTCDPAPLVVHGSEIGRGLPCRRLRLDELRSLLLRRSAGHLTRDAAWRVLVRRARVNGPAWVVGAAGVALPALRTITRRLTVGYSGEVFDVEAEVLAGFLDALHTLDLDRCRIMLRLCRAARQAGARTRYAEAAVMPRPLPPLSPCAPPRPWGHPDLVLADAIAKRVITRAEADLIGRTRLEGVSLTRVAVEWDLPYARLAQRRWRAEHRLAEAIGRGDVAAAVSNPAA